MVEAEEITPAIGHPADNRHGKEQVDAVTYGPRVKSIVLLLAICLAFVVTFRDTVWSVSGDLGQHYALASRIADQGSVATDDPALGIMSVYPRVSHTLAAILGNLLGSTFLGVHILALSAVAILWLGVVLVLANLPRSLAVPAMAALLGLLSIDHFVLRIDLHGHEIVENYFFAQMVGDCFVLLALVLAIHLDRSRGLFWALALLLASLMLVINTHLLPATETLGLIGVLLLAYVLVEEKSRFSMPLRALVAFLILASGTAFIALHPQFRTMPRIAENNGYLRLNHITYPTGILVLCFLVLAASALVFRLWFKGGDRRSLTALRYLAAFGAAMSCLCLLQVVLVSAGLGSDYAVKKYAFDLTTVLLMQAAVLIGEFVRRLIADTRFSHRIDAKFVLPALSALSLAAALFLNTPGIRKLDTSEMVALERDLRAIAAQLPMEQGKSNVVVGLAGAPRTVDYMFSSGILWTSQTLAEPDLLRKGQLSDLTKYGYVVSSRTNRFYNPPDCKASVTGSLSVVAADCLGRYLPTLKDCRLPFDLTSNGLVLDEQLSGFSIADAQERWTVGLMARFSCSSAGQSYKKLTLILNPFVFGPIQTQRLKLRINGVDLPEIVLSTPRLADNPLTLDISGIAAPAGYTLELRLPDAASPKAAGLNADERLLGVSIRAIKFE